MSRKVEQRQRRKSSGRRSSSEWVIKYATPAEKVLVGLEKEGGDDWSLVSEALFCVRENPFAGPCITKLVGPLAGKWRVRKGRWRVVYEVDKKSRVVNVLYIRPRDEKTYRW